MDELFFEQERRDDVALAATALREARSARASGLPHAEQFLDEVLRLDAPEQAAEARLLRAGWRLDAGERDVAVKLLREAEKAAVALHCADLLLDVGEAWLRAGHPMCSANACRTALTILEEHAPDALSPPRRQLLTGIAYLQLAAGAKHRDPPVDPAEYLNRALKLNDPEASPVAALELAVHLGLEGNAPDADGLLRRAIMLDHPTASAEAAYELAAQLVRRGSLAEAEELLGLVRDECGSDFWADMAEQALGRLPQPFSSRIGNLANRRRGGVVRGPREVLIVGAGTGGQYVVEQLERDPRRRTAHTILGFVDDQPPISGMVASRYPYLGRIDELASLLTERRPHEVWLAMPTAPPSVKRIVAATCADAFIPLRTLPIIHEILRSVSLVDQLRPVRIEDVIGDTRIDIDREAGAWLFSKIVMIVGCGSVGAHLARAAAEAGADRIVLIDRSDTVLRDLWTELVVGRGCPDVHTHHSSSVDADVLVDVARVHDVQVLIHTAGSWGAAGVDKERRARIVKGLSALAAQLSALPALEIFVWRSTTAAGTPATTPSTIAAAAESILLGGIAGEDHVKRCVVRLPATLTSGSALIAALEHDVGRGLPVEVPEASVHHHYVHGHRAAELLLHAAAMASDREVYAVDSDIDLSERWLAELLFRLRGRTVDVSGGFRTVSAPASPDAPRPSGMSTAVDELVLLGRATPAERPADEWLRLLDAPIEPNEWTTGTILSSGAHD
jgi:hypothetical protein